MINLRITTILNTCSQSEIPKSLAERFGNLSWGGGALFVCLPGHWSVLTEFLFIFPAICPFKYRHSTSIRYRAILSKPFPTQFSSHPTVSPVYPFILINTLKRTAHKFVNVCKMNYVIELRVAVPADPGARAV